MDHFCLFLRSCKWKYSVAFSFYRHGNGKFDVEDIDPFLCTHAAFGFAGLNKNTYEVKVLDPWNELETNYGKGAYNRFTKLKLINPNLKTLLSVGGWNEGNVMPMIFLF